MIVNLSCATVKLLLKGVLRPVLRFGRLVALFILGRLGACCFLSYRPCVGMRLAP